MDEAYCHASRVIAMEWRREFLLSVLLFKYDVVICSLKFGLSLLIHDG